MEHYGIREGVGVIRQKNKQVTESKAMAYRPGFSIHLPQN